MAEPTAEQETQAKALLWCVGIAVALLAYGWIAGAIGGDDGPTAEDRRAAAIDACRSSVRAQLKSPSSAIFSGEVATGTTSRYEVRGLVDSDNSFGASLRTSWTCTAVQIGDSTEYLGRATLIE